MINAHGFPPGQIGGGEWRVYRLKHGWAFFRSM